MSHLRRAHGRGDRARNIQAAIAALRLVKPARSEH